MTTRTAPLEVAPPTATAELQRWVLALLMPVGPAAVAVLRFVLPYDTSDSASEIVTKVAADPDSQRLVLWMGLLAALTLVPGALAALSLTRRRVPVLTLFTGALLVPGYLALNIMIGLDAVVLAGIEHGVDAGALTTLVDALATDLPAALGTVIFVIGHLVGTVLLGVALGRAGVLNWAWAAVMAVSQPLHLVAAMTGNHPLDLLAWGMTAAAMGAVAVVALRRPSGTAA